MAIIKADRARVFLVLVLGMTIMGQVLAAGLEVSLDRTRILEGETVLLTLSAPGDSWGIPELGGLGDDFDVKNQGQSTRMTIVNGHSTSTREWQFLLAPKRSGGLTIPEIRVGDLASRPIELEVLPAAQAAELGETLPVVLEVEVDEEAPYVQGQVVYTARVLVRVNVQNAGLEDPSAEGVIIERMGEDKSYQIYREGQRYKVIERRYAIFPQHSGVLKISSPVLSGAIPERNGGRGQFFGGSARDQFDRLFGRDPFEDMGGLLQRTRPIQVRGPELALNVRPQPPDSASPWLPAESLELAETWTPEPGELRVGDPVTRTIAITAQGLTAAQLPDLVPATTEGIKVYPNKPRTETRAEGNRIVSIREIKLAMVPSTAGELTLPEVRLVWWDTERDQERVAALPARVVQVLPAVGAGAEGSPAPDVAVVSEPTPYPSETASRAAVSGNRSGRVLAGMPLNEDPLGRLPVSAGFWPWLTAALGFLWLITIGLWLRARGRKSWRRSGQPATSYAKRQKSRSAARSSFKRACEANDPTAARDALLLWAALQWPEDPPRRLESLAARLGDPAGGALDALDRSLYSDEGIGWDGGAAWDLLKSVLPEAKQAQNGSNRNVAALPPLYPQRL